MSRDELSIGTRVRLKTRTIFGWRGTGTILYGTLAIKDGGTHPRYDTADACRHQWAVLRDQTPNPEHALPLQQYRERTGPLWPND